jgi:hypothetical protein
VRVLNDDKDAARLKGAQSRTRPADKLRHAGVAVIADRFHAIIHDFVMLNALADTNAARGAITLATDTLRTGCPTRTEAPAC